jgi:hypothetical protein
MNDPIVVGSIIIACGIVIAAWMISRKSSINGVAPKHVEFPISSEGNPVAPSGIPVTPETDLEVGSPVLAYEQGLWWRAEVIAVEPNDMVRIHFPGWDNKWDWSVPRSTLQVDLRDSLEDK